MRRMVRAAVCGLVLTGACAWAQSGADILDITRVQVRGEKTKDFEDAIKKLADVNRRYKGDRWIALSTEYGEFGGYSFSSTRENMAAVETAMGAFQNALKEGLGPMGDKLMHDLMAYSASGESQVRRRRWDLSVNAPSTKEDFMKITAQTRWIRALTLNIKPGHTGDYLQAWKPFMAELQKVSPPVPMLVSESATGAPALYVGVFLKSWAELDSTAPGIQQAVESDAYRQLMKVTQDAVASSKWEMLRMRPELSCPPDEIVQADPAFWKTKPAMAAPAPKPKSDSADKK